MYILGAIIVIGLLIWAILDYRKNDIELRRCPKCNTVVKQNFTLNYKSSYISSPSLNGENLDVKIYKCQKCGSSWNCTYEYNDISSA
jgi:hypothetical protein